MPYINPFGAGVSKIGTDNRTTDTELLDDDKLKATSKNVPAFVIMHN